jgi:hypothetical protein
MKLLGAGSMRKAVFLAGILVFCAQVSEAQNLPFRTSSEKMDLNVPTVVTPGSVATITGLVPTNGKPGTVRISITPPSAAPVSMSVTTGANGDFTSTFSQTMNPGRYQVSVTSASGTAEANFAVIELNDLIDSVTHEVQELEGSAMDLESRVERRVALAPDSAKKQALMAKLRQFRADVDESRKLWISGSNSNLPNALKQWGKQVQHRPDVWAKAAPLFSKLLDWTDTARTGREKVVEIAKKLGPVSTGGAAVSRSFGPYLGGRVMGAVAHQTSSRVTGKFGRRDSENRIVAGFMPVSIYGSLSQYDERLPGSLVQCEDIHDTRNLLELAGTLLVFYGGPVDIAVELGALAVGSFLEEGGALGVSAASKTGLVLAKNGHHLGLNLVKFAVELGPMLMDHLGSERCDTWEGDFSALTEARACNGFGHQWWAFNVLLEGKLSLRIAKTGSPRQLAGEFEGMATQLDVWEKAASVLTENDTGGHLEIGEYAFAFHKLFGTTLTPDFAISGDQAVKRKVGAVESPFNSSCEVAQKLPANLDRKWLAAAADRFGEAFPAKWSSTSLVKMPGGTFINIVATPTSFSVPVRGELHAASHKLTLRLQPARWDLNDFTTQAHAKYLLVSFLAGLPLVKVLEIPLPYSHARKILARALGSDGSDPDNDPVRVNLSQFTSTARCDSLQWDPECDQLKDEHGGQIPPLLTDKMLARLQEIRKANEAPIYKGEFSHSHGGPVSIPAGGSAIANYNLVFEVCFPRCEK